MISAGLDIGSRQAKAVLLGDGGILAVEVCMVDDTVARIGKRIVKDALKKAGVSAWKLKTIAATGYGRNNVKAGLRFPDSMCLARGMNFLDPRVRTVIDVGGLITRVVAIGENGAVQDYLENERCAAGSGRFLEMIAEALEIPLSEIGPLSLQSTRTLHFSSQCVVFAESEVINQVNAGQEPADILAGLHRSIAERVAGLAKRIGLEAPVCITGGVAKNRAVTKALEQGLDCEIVALEQDPRIVGALGAAVLARQ